MATDLYSMVTGKLLGVGASRTVFDFMPDPTLVIKFETVGGSFDNVMEWDIWENCQYDKRLAKWLAPCHMISPCGSILLQKKTTPVSIEQLPKKIPRFFTDLKHQNWGMLDGRPVCHDFANHLAYAGGTLHQLVKADWWG
jgi:hypothetical protein